MPRLIWSAAGLRDVQRLYRFLADKDENAARRAISAIRQGFKTIARQPGIGRPAEDMDPDYREWPIEFGGSGYGVLYRYHQQTAVVLAVRHPREAGYRAAARFRPPARRSARCVKALRPSTLGRSLCRSWPGRAATIHH